jgi:AraC family transcriptional regulator of adaptative response/methylated-DNA-[protein]-cysteine methyltransferase
VAAILPGMNDQLIQQQATDYQRVEQAIQYLEDNFRQQPSLDKIAAHVHLSKYHFQRLFKEWAGVSPTQYMHYLTVEYAKEQLAKSQSVYEASLDSGLSGSGRLHDLFVTFEAVTPGEYKQQGEGLNIRYGFHETPFGECLIAATSRGICALHFVTADGQEAILAELKDEWPLAGFEEDAAVTRPLCERIFSTPTNGHKRPIHLLLKGTNFQVQVWRALLDISPGMMVSYQDVADHIDQPQAVRAAAGAVAKNPIGYLIPCHRVINKNGRTHRYRWGSARKKAILGWEAANQASPRLAPKPATRQNTY